MKKFPHYVSSDYDRFLMESDPVCKSLLEWHRELVAVRKMLISARKFDASMKMWKAIDPVWRALKARFVWVGGVVGSSKSAVAA